jgi:ethanolaminephosphotransferase
MRTKVPTSAHSHPFYAVCQLTRSLERSLVSRYVLNPFWNWLVTLWPLNVAPNTARHVHHLPYLVDSVCILQITLTGLCIVFINFLSLIYYDPLYLTERDATNHRSYGPPQWLYFTYVLATLFQVDLY